MSDKVSLEGREGAGEGGVAIGKSLELLPYFL